MTKIRNTASDHVSVNKLNMSQFVRGELIMDKQGKFELDVMTEILHVMKG